MKEVAQRAVDQANVVALALKVATDMTYGSVYQPVSNSNPRPEGGGSPSPAERKHGDSGL